MDGTFTSAALADTKSELYPKDIHVQSLLSLSLPKWQACSHLLLAGLIH